MNDPHPSPRHRNAAIYWAKNLLESKDWVILDTETTGLGKNDEIIQLGVIGSDGTVLLDTLLKPMKKRMPKEAVNVHGITMAMLKDQPTFADLIDTISNILHNKIVVIYNAEYDKRLISQTAQKFQVRNILFREECAMLRYAAYIGELSTWKKGEYRWQKLPRAQRHTTEKHGAVGDCQLTLDLLRVIAGTEYASVSPRWWERIAFWKEPTLW